MPKKKTQNDIEDDFMLLIGHHFDDRKHLRKAITHRSFAPDNNERYEFLGDAILNQIISLQLVKRFPKDSEGTLTLLRSSLVKGDTLVAIGKTLGLERLLILGDGERKFPEIRPSILGNAVEALIAAIFLDAGWEISQKIVLGWYEDYFLNLEAENFPRHPKTALQEFTHRKYGILPTYLHEEENQESTESRFRVSCSIGKHVPSTTAAAPSKKSAEEEAARKMLALIEKSGDL